jgi:hypothetical protein
LGDAKETAVCSSEGGLVYLKYS